jgi:Zn-dependent protease
VSSVASDLTGKCRRCSHELPPGALDCPQCHALVHEQQLDRVAARARAFEANGSLWDAREQWQSALHLLPSNSKQAAWIRGHIRELETTIKAPGAPDTRKRWAKWLAPLAPIAVLLAKFKTVTFAILKLKFLFSFGAFLAVYWAAYGAKFGIGFAVLILVHELGHFIDVKRRGLPAEMPVFLPGLGAYVQWQAMGVTLETRAAVSLAGPLAGWIGAAVCAILWFQTGDGVWAALARSSAWLNVLNLIPIWMLDGRQATLALSKLERAMILVASVALGALLEEWSLLLIGAGMLWRLFTKDNPREGSRAITAYFLIVMAGLTLVMWLMPLARTK